MRLITKEIPRDCTLLVWGCTHVGAANCHYSGIDKLVTRLKDTDVFGLNLGDNIEGKIPMDKHFDLSSIDLKRMIISPQDQAEKFVSLFHPVREKIFTIGRGNHEYKLRGVADMGRLISASLGVDFGWYLYKFRALDSKGKARFKIFAHHGFGTLKSNAKDPIQALANKKAALKQKFINTRISDAILSVGSHWHQQLIVRPTYLDELHIIDQGGKITQHIRQPERQHDSWIPPEARWYAASGCMRMSYTQPGDNFDDYSEIQGYGASDLGWVEVEIKDYQVMNVKAVKV